MKPLFVFAVAVSLSTLVSCGPLRPLKIGVVGSFTGATSFLSDEVRAGIEYQREILKADRKAPPIELVFLDDRASPELAKRHVADLAAQGCALVIGPMTSGIGLAAAEQAAASEIPVLSPTVSVGALSGKGDFFFRLYPSAEALGRFLGAGAALSGIRAVAVVGDASNAVFAEEWRRGFASALAEAGGSQASFGTFPAGAAFEPRRIADAAAAAGGDAVLLVFSATHTAAILPLLRGGPRPPALFSSTWAFTSYGELVSYAAEAAENVRSAILFDPESADPAWKAFDAAMEQTRGTPASPAAALGAECLIAAAEAYGKGGRDRESFGRALSGLTFRGLQGEIRLDEFGDVDRPVHEAVVSGGRVVVVEGNPAE